MAPTLVSDSMMLDLFKQDRSPGPHVSRAIHRIMESLYPDRFSDEPPNQTRLNLGNAMEKSMIRAMQAEHPDRYVIPGELERDGIKGTPDLWDVYEWATVELKLTWASSKRAEDIEDVWFWRYWIQLKSYCWMAGMNTGFLIIVFINGDYRWGQDSGQPVTMMWREDFSDDDLHETWQMVKANMPE